MVTTYQPMAQGSFGRSLLEFLSAFLGVAVIVLAVGGMFVQNIANYKNQSTKGFSTDFAISSFLGFVFLQVYMTLGLVDPFSEAGRVHITDEFLVILLVLSSGLALTQCYIYANDPAKSYTWWISGSIMGFFFVAGMVEGYTGVYLSSYFPLSLL